MHLISGRSTRRFSLCILCVYTLYCTYFLILFCLSLYFHINSYYMVWQSFHLYSFHLSCWRLAERYWALNKFFLKVQFWGMLWYCYRYWSSSWIFFPPFHRIPCDSVIKWKMASYQFMSILVNSSQSSFQLALYNLGTISGGRRQTK
jgi:hypothetical protein